MKRIPQLDGLRGLAVLLVLVHNTDAYPSLHLGPIQRDGWMGVDLFFVLSGFLITGILLDTKVCGHSLKNFYARRCLRIWPLYYAVLGFMFFVVPHLRPAEATAIFAPRSSPWWSYLFYLQNYLVPVPTRATGLLGVTWSLAVEEQFYLVWPLVVWLLTPRALRRVVVTVIVLSPLLRFVLAGHGVILYSNPACRLDGLMAGALLALLARTPGMEASRYTAVAWIAAPAALLLAIRTGTEQWLQFSLVALAASALVYLALFAQAKTLQAVLRARFLAYTGTISYAMYLLEKIPLDAVKAFHAQGHPWLAFTGTTAATYVLATLSWYLLEKPFLRLKRHFEVSTAAVA